jgi:hypothetical protein
LLFDLTVVIVAAFTGLPCSGAALLVMWEERDCDAACCGLRFCPPREDCWPEDLPRLFPLRDDCPAFGERFALLLEDLGCSSLTVSVLPLRCKSLS